MTDERKHAAICPEERRSIPVLLRWVLYVIPWAVFVSAMIYNEPDIAKAWLFWPGGLFYFMMMTPSESSWAAVFSIAALTIGWSIYILHAIFLLRAGSIVRFITLYGVFLALLAFNRFGWIRILRELPFRQ